MKTIAVFAAALLLASSARAIELSLEENRAERGSVGYVDMQRLFTNSPDAQHAREGFEELVRQAEERVNLRKAELLKLHQELDAARGQRDALAEEAASAPAVSTAAPAEAPPISAPAAPAHAPVAAPTAAVSSSTSVAASSSIVSAAAKPVAASSQTAAAVAVSSAASASPFAVKPTHLALPGMPEVSAAPTGPPAASSSTAGLDGLLAAGIGKSAAAAAAKPAVALSSGASAASLFPAQAPPTQAAAAPKGPTVGQRLLELDAKIIALQDEIAQKEGALTREHDDADRGLLGVESRKTDQVLARLYRAISEVAREEGVSVVIDKTTLLYGHPAVDLTDKVLKHLSEAPAP